MYHESKIFAFLKCLAYHVQYIDIYYIDTTLHICIYHSATSTQNICVSSYCYTETLDQTCSTFVYDEIY